MRRGSKIGTPIDRNRYVWCWLEHKKNAPDSLDVFVTYGYRNSGPKGTLEIEPREAEVVLWLYKTYATGDYSLQELRNKFKTSGLIYRNRYPVPAKGHIHQMLKNPIYYGIMQIKGELYPGSHDPIVPKDLYDKVQEVFRAANKPKKTSRTFTYSGLMECATCGCSITSEIHKGRYVYYHCTGNRGPCEVHYLREESLDPQFEEVVKRLDVGEQYYDLILRTLQDAHKDELEFRRKADVQLQKHRDILKKRLDQAYIDKLDGVITDELWKGRSSDWTNEIAGIDNQIRAGVRKNRDYLQNITCLIELAKNAYPCYLQQDPVEKRKMLQILASNYSLNGCDLHYTYKKPFNWIVEGSESANWSG